MKKRMLAMLLALVMIVSVLPLAAFAAVECTKSDDGFHHWTDKSSYNTKYRQCDECGATCGRSGYGNTQHNYGKNDPNPGGKCKNCGMICPNTSNHRSNRDCGTCGQRSNEHVHSYDANGKCTVTKNGLKCTAICSHAVCSSITGKCKECPWICQHNGTVNSNKVCSKCGMTVATCEHPEYEDGKCSECGEDCPHDKYVAIPEKTPTCTQTGTTGGTWCDTCHTIQTPATIVPVTKHNFSEFVSGEDATCEENGYGRFKCSTCEETEDRVIPAGHNMVATKVFVEATCEHVGVAYFECSKCPLTKLDWIAVLPHTEEIVPAIEATCTATGLTEGLRCKACGNTLQAQEVTDKLPHSFTVSVEEEPATCTADGYTPHMKCATCDATEGKKVLHLLGHNFVNFICTRCNVRDGSCEHVNGVISIQNATCTEDGKESFTCPDCGYEYEKTLPHPGHSAVEGICTTCGTVVCNHPSNKKTVNTTPSTCSEYGTRTETCTCGWSKTVRLPLADHDYVNGVCKNCKCIGSKNNTIDFNDVFIVG